jgi:bifunctional DNA-binding transcriptional regulator/antitoxin component of YhaV-PrlF toxin-antitoxin module
VEGAIEATNAKYEKLRKSLGRISIPDWVRREHDWTELDRYLVKRDGPKRRALWLDWWR